MHTRCQITAACLFACMLAVQLSLPAVAAGADFEAVTGHVDIAPAQTLSVLYPTEDIQTTASGFQITGSSDSGQELTMNGVPVENRGAGGTFAVYVPLSGGANTFTFRQGGAAAAVTITRGSRDTVSAAYTDPEGPPKALPQYDLAVKSGGSFSLKCYAPTGTAVTAAIGGKEYALAKNGAYFSGSYSVPQVEGTLELGAVHYTITGAGGTRTQVSEGSLFAVGGTSDLQVQIKSMSTMMHQEASTTSGYVGPAKQGAVDRVVGYNGDMYKLATGGWIPAKSVRPLVTRPSQNKVSSVSFSADSRGESFTFSGTSHPMHRGSHTASELRITLCDTSGIGSIDVSRSTLFSGATVTEEDGHTTITLRQAKAGALWGYMVAYRDGQTVLYCKYRPKLSGDGSRPLQGITVAVDAGHGGSDPGALGITYGYGITEKDVNLANATALRKKLELLGAEVVQTRVSDIHTDLNARSEIAEASQVDFVVSLHANSIGYSGTAAAANGVEVYYYEPIAVSLAQDIAAGIAAGTGRTLRGAKHSGFVITLNSYAPAVLVEMGFMLNPRDFDSMCSKQGIYNTVTAIADSLIAALR